jgi:hypothetical protein
MVKKKSRKSVPRRRSVQKKGVPAGVKILSILGYIGSAATLILAILFFVGSTFIGEILEKIQTEEASVAAVVGQGFLIVMGIVFLGFAILDFFLARGLWKGQNWARIFFLILLSLSALGSLISILGGEFSDIIGLVISGFLIWYLGFNKEVRAAFQ